MGGSFFSGTPSRPKIVKEFKRLREPTVEALLSIFQQPGFEGELIAPITEPEQALVDRLAGLDFLPAESEGRETLQRTARGEFLRPDSNPFLADAIRTAQRPILEAFTERQKNLRGVFTAGGQRIQESSPFARAQAIEERGLANALEDVAVEFAARNFENERKLQQRSAELTQQLRAEDIKNDIARLEAVALPRLIADVGIQRAVQTFNQRIQVLLAAAGLGVQAQQPIGTTGGIPSPFLTISQGLNELSQAAKNAASIGKA